MTKCVLCGQFYGPFSMERHLKQDHALGDDRESYQSGYRAGKADGERDGYRRGYADAPNEIVYRTKETSPA